MTDQALDVQLLQTAASVENVLVAAYDILLGLPQFTAPTGNQMVKNLLSQARGQHADHASGCNDLAAKLGGKAQTGENSALAQKVTTARSAGLGDVGPVIELAFQLETASAHTHQNAVGLLSDLNARRLAGAILTVESQHVGLLGLLRSIVAAHTPELVTIDQGNAQKVSPDEVKAGSPDAEVKPDQARPANEGALK